MSTRQTDGKYDGYQDGDLLICVDCGIKKPHVDGPGEDGICGSARNGDAVCDDCEDIRAGSQIRTNTALSLAMRLFINGAVK